MQKNRIINCFGSNMDSAKQLMGHIHRHSKGAVARFEQLYQTEGQKVGTTDSFSTKVCGQSNHLLLARSVEGVVWGAFSVAPLQAFKSNRRRSKEGGFVFRLREGELLVWDLKEGQPCVEYDTEFIIYGNEEVVVDRKALEVEIAPHDLP